MIEYLDRLADAGVDSFKIEGRMKGINYVAGVVKTYREAIDCLKIRPYSINKRWLQELSMFSSRGYTTGMFMGKQPDSGYNHDDEKIYRMSHELVGVIKSVNNGKAVVALRNSIKIGDNIEFLSPGLENKTFEVKEILNQNQSPVTSGHNEETVLLPIQNGVKANDLIRRQLSQS
jgi:putative protease